MAPERLLDHKIRLGARRAVESVGLIGELDVPGIPILVGVDRDREDAAVFCRADDANRDLPAIGDEYLRDASHSYLAYWGTEVRPWLCRTKTA